jgi:sugar lactone lactonase YvrE/tetratricopeptide (TPR) repeat protein
VLTLVKGDRPAEVQEPYRAVVVEDGRLFLTDSRKGDVLWFDENLVWKGNLAAQHPGRDLGRPVRTVADSRGRIYVADAENRRIDWFEDGQFGGSWGGRGDDPGKFDSLDDIAVDVDDMVWAADGGRGVINVFTPDGLLERVIPGFTGAGFAKPALLAVDPARGVYVYDADRKTVFAGDMDGNHRWTFDLNQRMGGKELFDLEVDPAGALFLVLADKSRVAILEPTGELRGEIFGSAGRPAKYEKLTGLSISGSRGVMTVVDQKDLLVQEIRLDWADESAFLEPVPRSHESVVVDTLSGRVVAVAPGAAGSDEGERWLVREGTSLVVLDPSGQRAGQVLLPGELPKRLVTTGTGEGFVLVGEDRRMRILSREGEVVSSLPQATAGGELKRPDALAWRAGDGAIAVYDRDDDEIQILSSEGVFLQRVGRKGTGVGEISRAVSMSFSDVGHLLVVDLEGSRVQEFDEHGIYVAGSGPVTINRDAGNIALAVGADTWGRTFLLDEATGTAAQIGPDGVECQVGAPWLMSPVTGFAITPAGDMLVGGGRETTFRTVRFRCLGPPPTPRGLSLTLDTGPEGGALLAWVPNTPGARSFEVFRREVGGEAERVSAAEGSSVVIPRQAWGSQVGELFVRGVSEDGVAGPYSSSVTDRLTPALRGLAAGDDVPTAESLLREELAIAQDEGRGDVVSLRAVFLQSIIAQGEYDRARSELEAFEATLDPEQASRMRLDIARAAVSGAIRAGAGETAVNWLRPIGDMAPETMSPVERLALDLDEAGDTELAAEMLVRHGYEANLDGAELTLALAAVQVAKDRPEQAMRTLIDASRDANGPGLRRQLDRGIFQLASDVADGLLDGSIVGRPDLTAEQQVDVVLRNLEEYSAEASGSSAEEWELRLGALAAKPRIHRAVELEGSDFDAARELYEAILAETPFLLQSDEIRVRGRLGALALAEGREEDAREAFGQVLEISPNWVPAEEDFSPSVRSFVAEMQGEAAEAEFLDGPSPEDAGPGGATPDGGSADGGNPSGGNTSGES